MNQREIGRKTAPWKMYSESFIIRRDAAEKADLGDTRDRQRDNKSRRSFFFATSSGKASSRSFSMKTSAVKESLDIII